MPESRPPNVIEHVWLAYAFAGSVPDDLDARLARVGSHYQEVMAEAFRRDVRDLGGAGAVLWQVPNPRLRWPLWAEDREGAAAWSSAPTGWTRLAGSEPPESASLPVARRLADDVTAATGLNPPYLVAVADAAGRRLEIAQDPLGIGRLYELKTEGGWVWSNRLGALPLFAGVAPRVDSRAWSVLAAAGWFLGEGTALEGVRKLEGGARISVRAQGSGWEAAHSRSRAREELVAPRDADPERSAAAAAEEALEVARDVARLWDAPAAVDLTGGRDSRVSAAAAVAAGLDATYQTVNADPGELEVAGRLAEIAGVGARHAELAPEPDSTDADMRARLAALHHFHDGMVNPQAGGRGAIEPVHSSYSGPVVSGHGGELGHGFYYRSPERLAQLQGKGLRRMLQRLMTMARKDGDAAQPQALEAYRNEVERALQAGKDAGVTGPPLLDWFYLAQRFAHRSGLAVRADRYSACATPAFVRACFDLRPPDRLAVKVHRAVVHALVPDWDEVPFFAGPGTSAQVHYQRVWERQANVDYLEPLIAGGGTWEELYDADRVRALWREAREGGGTAHHERLFLRIAWRHSFEEHLALLAARVRPQSAAG
jgi:hypothetical protein